MLSRRALLPIAALSSLAVLSGCSAASSPSGEDNGAGASSGSGSGGAGTSGATGTTGSQGSSGSSTSSTGGGASDAGPTGAAGSKLHVVLDETSVSGLSSGAFMAVQFHVAFSSIMKGAAVFAGGPYHCANGSESTAESNCMYPTSAPSIAPCVTITKQYAASGDIDDPSNLSSQKVFLFGGADDHTVAPVVMDALDSYYATYMDKSAIEYVDRRPGTSHTMPTLDYGTSCDESMTPYIGKCNYDGAGLALAQIYGTLNPAATTLSGTIVTLPQSQFISSPSSHALAADGYAYVPASCAKGATCRVHVAFHGCEQNVAAVGSDFYEHAGYNPWADTNNIIVLYPQTSTGDSDFEGCWDWYGFTGADYATKSAPQMAMVRAMIDFLVAGGPLPSGGSSGGSGAGTASDAGASPLEGADASVATTGATCFTDTNKDHVTFGRAHVSGSDALANGSNDDLGADSETVMTSLKETSAGYYVKTASCF
jgi:hypothetical protein